MDLSLYIGFALILVSGLILLLGQFMKNKREKVSLMDLMSYQSFGPKIGVAMVKVGREVLLVGVTPTDIQLLTTLDRHDGEADILAGNGGSED